LQRFLTRSFSGKAVAVKRVTENQGKHTPGGDGVTWSTVPRIADRVVQTAAMLVLDPIFEADLQPEQYAYRRDRGAGAVRCSGKSFRAANHKKMGHRRSCAPPWS
jgi:retron-type reverse transcriptase